MKLSNRGSLLVFAAALLLAALLDRTVLVEHAPFISNAVLVKPGAVVFGVPFLPELILGVVPLLVVPLSVMGLIVVPYRNLLSRESWTDGLRSWLGFAIACLAILPIMLIGGFAFSLVEEYLPAPLTSFAEAFGFRPTLYLGSKDVPILGPLNGSLACLLGLAVGSWLALRQLRD